MGSLDLERALGRGETAYQPGLLAAAHRGLLYVDEVNLLHDHLVDLLLDAAAMGRNTVERDGVSVTHAARIVLVGTMNPEEGELRPQLLDRFGLTVEVAAPRDPSPRAEVVRRRMAFDADPAAFAARFGDEQEALRQRIATARARVARRRAARAVLERIAHVCAGFEVDGLRADIVTARAAVAHAAWSGRTEVTLADVRTAARLALPHRRRRNPFDSPGLDEDLLDALLGDDEPEPDPTRPPEPDRPRPRGRDGRRRPGDAGDRRRRGDGRAGAAAGRRRRRPDGRPDDAARRQPATRATPDEPAEPAGRRRRGARRGPASAPPASLPRTPAHGPGPRTG